MKRSLLMMLAIITLAVLAAQASSESLSRRHLLPHGAGILSEQTSSSLSPADRTGMLFPEAGPSVPTYNGSDAEPRRLSGQELNLPSTDESSLTDRAKTEEVLDGDDEEEDKEEGEEGEKEDEEDEGGGWDRVWDVPKLG